MYKVFKTEEEIKGEPIYQIVGQYLYDDQFEIVCVYFDREKNKIYLEYAVDTWPDFYELESVYDRVTDAMVHIKFELNLREKLDKQDGDQQ